MPRGGQGWPRRGEGEAKGGQREAKGGQGEAKDVKMEAKGGQGRPKGCHGEAKGMLRGAKGGWVPGFQTAFLIASKAFMRSHSIVQRFEDHHSNQNVAPSLAGRMGLGFPKSLPNSICEVAFHRTEV